MLTSIRSRDCRRARSGGATMIEVLVALLILTVGLLGVAGLQARMQTAEIEAFQRAQAIVLLQDMVDRINANRRNTAAYVTSTPLGVGSTLDCSAPATIAAKDMCEWSDALAGGAESKTVSGVTTNLGAMSEARGCITNPVTTMPREVVVAVVWQGVSSTVAPTVTACGSGVADYGSDGKLRRAIVARVKVGCLQNDVASGQCWLP